MLCEVESSLTALSEWITAVDEQATHRLPLLRRAARIVNGLDDAAHDVRLVLAEQLERWRYQDLDAMRRRPHPLGCRLAELLDLLSRRLSGRFDTPPRAARTALENTFCTPIEVRRALDCLDARVPLETVAQRAGRMTAEHFTAPGTASRRMLLYAPLYLSSHCTNYCTYCAFRAPNVLERRHLSMDEALRQAEMLVDRGLRHILLVAGDYPRLTSTEYYVGIIRALTKRGLRVAVEIAPQSTSSYAALARAGACGVTLYQEVYDAELYAAYHAQGAKAAYDWRLEGLERAAEGGIGRLGMGILLGLGEPREELATLVRHAVYLRGRHPDCTLAFSLPRIHEAPDGFHVPHPVDDETFIRMYCGLRYAFPAAELVLSTRERPELRDRLAAICITQLSAGSSTAPGGYSEFTSSDSHGQFPIHDTRTVDDMAAWCRQSGFTVAWT